jgi:hypothetical protein
VPLLSKDLSLFRALLLGFLFSSNTKLKCYQAKLICSSNLKRHQTEKVFTGKLRPTIKNLKQFLSEILSEMPPS